MSAHRAWWPPDGEDHQEASPPPKTMLSLSMPPAQLPPQRLWPHHALPGNSSPSLAASSNDCTQNNDTARPHSSAAPRKHTSLSSPEELIEPIRPLYAGIFLSGPSKHRLFERYPPRHAATYAHHVKIQDFGFEGDIALDVAKCLNPSFPLGSIVAIGVVGSADDDYYQAIEVTLPSWVKSQYENTSVPPHVTVSVVEEGEARGAGLLLKDRKSQGKIESVHGLRVLHGILGVCLTDRRVVYSEGELREAVALGSNCNDDGDQGCGGPCGRRDRSRLPLSQPSSRLLGLETEKEEKRRSSNSNSSSISVDLVSILHQCFPPLHVSFSPTSKTVASTASVEHNIKRPHCRQLMVRPTPRILDDTGRKRRSRNDATTEVVRSSAQGSHSSSIAVSARSWWNTSSSKVTSPITTASCSIQEDSKEEDLEQHHCSTHVDTAFQLDLGAAEIERATMKAHHTAYKSALLRSKHAKSAGNHTSARAHARTAHRHASSFLVARQRSSAAAFHAHNAATLNIFKLDLHGMHVKEAVTVLKKYVEGLGQLHHPGALLVKVVTGFGKHSAIPGRAKILPAVIEYLAEAGVLFDVEEENPGMVRVLLEHSRRGWL